MDEDLLCLLTSHLPLATLRLLPFFYPFCLEREGFNTKYISNNQTLINSCLITGGQSSSEIYGDCGVGWYVKKGKLYVERKGQLFTFPIRKVVSDAACYVFLSVNGRLIRNDRDEVSQQLYLHAVSGPGIIIALGYDRKLYRLNVWHLNKPEVLIEYLPPPVYFCNQPRSQVVVTCPDGTYAINRETCTYYSFCYKGQVLNFIDGMHPGNTIIREMTQLSQAFHI